MEDLYKTDKWGLGYSSYLLLRKSKSNVYELTWGFYKKSKSLDELIKDVEKMLNEVKKVNKEEKRK